MGTRVKVRQDFGATPGVGPTPVLETVIIGPLNRSIQREVAGRYDTTDATETCYSLPSLGVGTTPNIDIFRDLYADPVFNNARYPDLCVDAERNLTSIQDNRNAYRFFRESYEDRTEVAEANGGWADDEIFQSFHPNLVPGSIVIAKEVSEDLELTDTVTYIPVANFPAFSGGLGADGIIDGTVRVTDPNTGSLVYRAGVDYNIYFDFDQSSPGAGNTRWAIEIIDGGLLSTGLTVKLEFEGKFPLKYGTELDVEVDYVNGSIQNKTGEDLDDAIFYYAFMPVVSFGVILRERVSGQLTQLDGTDFTVKEVAGVKKLCVRPGRQGALFVGDGFTITDTIKSGDRLCGTKTEEFDVRGPCGVEPECDTLRVCVYNGTTATNYDVFFNGPGGGGSPDNGLVDAGRIVTDINNKAGLRNYVVAYEQNGKVCLRLRGTDPGDLPVTPPYEDARGADRYFEIKPVARDFAPVLGLAYGKVCGHTQYQVEDAGTEFQDQQDAFGNVLGSIIIDVDGNRYRIDQIVDDETLLITHVDADNVEVCGPALTAPNGVGTYKMYYADWSSEIIVSYTAARTDLGSELIELTDGFEDVLAKLSEDGTQANFSLGPDNPLAYALAKWYFANSTHSVLALPTNGRGLAAIQQAIETLELSERPHCLIPLTADRDSCRALADHVMAMSDPDTTYEPQTRILVVTDIIENAKVLVDLANDGAEVRASYNPASRTYTSSTIDPTNYDSETGDAKVFRLVDGDGTTDVNFVTDGVTIGDKVRIHFGANAGDWKVLRVITGNGGTTSHELELTAIESGQYYKWDTNHSENATPGTTTGTNQNGLVSYTIWRPLTRAQHLDSIKTMGSDYRALQFGYRVTTTWAPLCIDEATPDGRSATVPGYFMNAALGAGCASAPVQQGFTNYPFAGTNRILFSKGHFTNAQLDTLETSGVWVWQSRPGENFFHCRMQYTVNGAVAAETLSRQFHIIRIADKMHRRFWSALIGFTGVYNITPENLAVLRMVLEATIQASMETRAPRVGPEILNGYVVSLTCDKNVPGQVTAITRIFPGEPIDAIDITNQVRRG